MKTRRLIALLAVALCLLAAIPGIAQGKVKLTVWGRDVLDDSADHISVTMLVKNFEAKNPDIDLEWVALGDPGLMDKTKIQMAVGSGLPDVFQTWGGTTMGSYADKGMLLDLTAELKSIPGSAAAASAVTWKGKIYGVAPFFAIAGIFLNEDLFKANGLSTKFATVADLEKAAATLGARGIQPFACGAKDKWPPLAMYMYLTNRYGGDIFTQAAARKERFDAEPFVKAATLYQNWAKKGFFGDKPLGEGYGDAQQLMATGRAAMHVTGSWMCAQYSSADFTDQNLGFYAFPTIAGGKGKVTDVMGMPDIAFAATKEAASKKAAAVKFLTYAMSTEAGQADPGRIASMPGVVSKSNLTKMATAVFGQSKTVQFWWDQNLPAAITTPMNETIQTFFLPETSVKASLTKYEQLAEANIK
jgi:ABC-type glycerol-3-phosphate transport system substrate-binding protein